MERARNEAGMRPEINRIAASAPYPAFEAFGRQGRRSALGRSPSLRAMITVCYASHKENFLATLRRKA